MNAMVIHEPSSLVQVEDTCVSVEQWAAGCDSVGELRDASNKLDAISRYLDRTSTEGRARVAAALRRLEVRIGELLGPAEVGHNQHSEGSVATEGSRDLSRHQRHEFRRMAANPDTVEDVIANSDDNNPPSRRRINAQITGNKPAPARRRPLNEAFFDGAYDLLKAAQRIVRLTEDDRFPANKEQAAAKHRSDLLRARDAIDVALERL